MIYNLDLVVPVRVYQIEAGTKSKPLAYRMQAFYPEPNLSPPPLDSVRGGTSQRSQMLTYYFVLESGLPPDMARRSLCVI